MFVRNWMSSPAVTIPPVVPVPAALAFMEKRKIRRLPVVEKERLIGILTKSDLLIATEREDRERLDVGDVMTRDPVSVAPEETLGHAAQQMLQRKISGLPVMEEEQVVGIITESDVFRALCEILGMGEPGARVVMSVPDDEDVLDAIRHRLKDLVLRSLATYHHSAAARWEIVLRVRGRVPSARR